MRVCHEGVDLPCAISMPLAGSQAPSCNLIVWAVIFIRLWSSDGISLL